MPCAAQEAKEISELPGLPGARAIARFGARGPRPASQRHFVWSMLPGRGPGMNTQALPADATAAGANRSGVYLAILQLVFTLGWTTYVIYLPKLAAEVGGDPHPHARSGDFHHHGHRDG